MLIELTLTNLIFIAIACTSALWALMKIIAVQGQRFLNARFEMHEQMENANYSSLEKRLSGIEDAGRVEANQWQRIERELLTLKADMPLSYVRREDYTRGQSVIEAKLDGLGSKFEYVQLRDRRKQNDPD